MDREELLGRLRTWRRLFEGDTLSALGHLCGEYEPITTEAYYREALDAAIIEIQNGGINRVAMGVLVLPLATLELIREQIDSYLNYRLKSRRLTAAESPSQKGD